MIPSGINFFINGADNLGRIFIPNIVKELGGSNFQVGLAVSVYPAMSFLSYYLFGRAADVYGRRTILRAGLFFSALAFLLQVSADDYWTLFTARALAGFCYGIAPAALIAYAYEKKKKIGVFSSYGALGWAAGSVAAGLLTSYDSIFMLSSLMLFAAFLASSRIPKASEARVHVPSIPLDLIRKNAGVYVPYFFRHLGANVTWTILPLYFVSIGASHLWIGLLYAINTGTQFLVMRRIDSIDNEKLIKWGLALSTIAFVCYSAATDYRQTIPIQIIVGFSWAFLYVGSLKSLLTRNLERATASGLLNSTIMLSGIIGPLLAGVITSFESYRVAMLFSAFLCLVSLVFEEKGDLKSSSK